MIYRIALTLLLTLTPLAAWPQAALLLGAQNEDVSAPTPTDALIEILEDEDARAELIERLRGGAVPEPSPATGVADSGPDVAPSSLGQRLAVSTKGAAESAAASISRVWLGLKKLPPTLASLGNVANSEVLGRAARDLGFVVVATYLLLYLLRIGARRIYFRMGQSAGRSGWSRTAALSISSNLVAILVIIGAWALGYVIMVAFSGGFGTVGIRQSLYLNAFLIVEMSKMLVRAVLAPLVGELRLVSVSDAAARSLSRWLSGAITLFGYSHLLAVPITYQAIGYLSGGALDVLISLFVIVVAATLVIVRRKGVADWLANNQPGDAQYRLRNSLAAVWHIPVLLYLATMFIIVATRPSGVLAPFLSGSGTVALAILGAMIVLSVLGRSIHRGVRLPEAVTLRLPALESRLNGIIPKVVAIIRVVVIFLVVLVTLDNLGLGAVTRWVGLSDMQAFWTTAVSVIILLVTIFALWLAFASWVDYRLNENVEPVPSSREVTLLTLLKNAVTVALVVFAAMFALSEIGINIAPLIASAGVLGLAIGFGAQKFVQDIITGIFIQFENAFNVGDYISVGGTSGTVERLTIRSVSLRDPTGAFHIIPFSSVDMVTNYTRDFAYIVCDMGVGYREDSEVVKQAMFDAFTELQKDEEVAENIVGELEWYGLQSFGDSAVVMRAKIKTKPGYQWGIGRAYNGALKTVFDARGIEIPFPHQTIYFGEDRDGKAPALNVRTVPPETG